MAASDNCISPCPQPFTGTMMRGDAYNNTSVSLARGGEGPTVMQARFARSQVDGPGALRAARLVRETAGG